jgi:hypothetical protein
MHSFVPSFCRGQPFFTRIWPSMRLILLQILSPTEYTPFQRNCLRLSNASAVCEWETWAYFLSGTWFLVSSPPWRLLFRPGSQKFVTNSRIHHRRADLIAALKDNRFASQTTHKVAPHSKRDVLLLIVRLVSALRAVNSLLILPGGGRSDRPPKTRPRASSAAPTASPPPETPKTEPGRAPSRPPRFVFESISKKLRPGSPAGRLGLAGNPLMTKVGLIPKRSVIGLRRFVMLSSRLHNAFLSHTEELHNSSAESHSYGVA